MPLDLSKPIRAVGWPDKVETSLYDANGGYILLVTKSPIDGCARRVFFVNPHSGVGTLANKPINQVSPVQFENVPDPIVGEPFFVNVYPNVGSSTWDSLDQANRCATHRRVACVKVQLTITPEGKILSTTEAV